MPPPNAEFTSITSIRPEALGEPGQRTFRLLVEDVAGSAMIWLEKEQLFQLAMAITRLQAILPSSGDAPSPSSPSPSTGEGWGEGDTSSPSPLTGEGWGEGDGSPYLEFTVGKMVLGHEGNSDRFVIDAYDAGIEESDDVGPTVRLWGVRDQLSTFAAEALKVCAAGRPICPLCSEPMDATGHKCARVNGHDVQPLTQDDQNTQDA